MKRDTKRVLILSLKIGVGSAIAIILAYFSNWIIQQVQERLRCYLC